MGFLHSLHRLLQNLAEISAPLRLILSQNNDYIWTDQCRTVLSLKQLVANITALKHFDMNKETRIVCDASHHGLGAMLECTVMRDGNPYRLHPDI